MSESKIAIARICGEKQWWGFHGHFYFLEVCLGWEETPFYSFATILYISLYIFILVS
jgi:hypothetical protein